MNEIQSWYCDICDKTINIESKGNILILNLINTKKKLVLLLKKKNLINQILMK